MPDQPNITDPTDKSIENIPVPPTPQVVKSSNEILCELFGAFNATPPSLDDITVPVDDVKKAQDKKHKKQKKKKSKKMKKKERSSSSNSKGSISSKKKSKKHKSKHSTSESESVKSRKRKIKLGKYSASDTDDNESLPKIKKKSDIDGNLSEDKLNSIQIKQEQDCTNTLPSLIQDNVLKHAVSRIVDKVIDSTKLKIKDYDRILSSQDNTKTLNYITPRINVKQEPNNPETVEVNDNNLKGASPKIDTVLNEDNEQNSVGSKENELGHKEKEITTNESDKPKLMMGKIKIQNLKFSQVYEATVKQIEEEAKRKAERYEEGELSDTTIEEKSPTPSLPSSDSLVEVILSSPVEKRKKCRHHHKKEKCHYRHRRRSGSKEKHSSHSHYRHKRRSRSRERYSEERRESKSRSRERSRDQSRSQSLDGSNDRTKQRKKSRSHERSKNRRKDRKRSLSRERSYDRANGKRKKERSRSQDKSKDWIRGKESSRSPDRIIHRKNHGEESEERAKSHEENSGTNIKTKSKETSKIAGHGHSEHTSSRNRTKSRRSSDEKIDKQKLLEIARKNALSMMKGGSALLEQNKVVSITAGGKTVSELTDFCKLLSQKDAEGHESISSDTDTSSGSESESRPFHHPFQLKDRNASIVLNIRNSVALPVKSLHEKTVEQARELRLQFPVSSGQHHRKTESEWIPVSPKRPAPLAITAPLPPLPPLPSVRRKRTFTDTPDPPMLERQKIMQEPLESIGQFTGSTGVKVLTQAELASGQQAWARRDQLQMAAPVNSGMGMTLLQKMGWRPGEGLGKNKEGTLQPLLLEVKIDKKGLVAQEELPIRQPNQIIRRTLKSLEGKHPVSLLNEYCSRRKFSSPQFDLIDEAGPDHKKNFRFKVKVNGIEYTPAVGSPKKKQARAEAAEICLKELGILPLSR